MLVGLKIEISFAGVYHYFLDLVTKGSLFLGFSERRVIYLALVCVKGVLVCGSKVTGVRIGLAFIGHKGSH